MINNILITEKSDEYELLDSGGGEKLERYGEVILSRPDPQAIWPKSLAESEWKGVDAFFTRTGTTGKWQASEKIKKNWKVTLSGLTFQLQLLPSKHVGVFPEQSAQWKWQKEKIEARSAKHEKIKVLNLFGYTGGASLACAKAGADVCHLDSSEFAVDLAHKNMELSGLSDKKIRFIVDDARKFIEREIKRGNKYDVIIMDPPVYGKGVRGEVWKIEEDLLPLITRLKNVLSTNPLAIVLNGYASGFSSSSYAQVIETITNDLKGKISHGEVAIRESSSDRLLPCGIYSRWEI